MSRQYILRDLEKVESGIAHLLLKHEDNHEILDSGYFEDYTEPDVNAEIVMPLTHPEGFFAYLSNLRRVLLKAYKTGSLQEDDLPISAPKYLEDLIW